MACSWDESHEHIVELAKERVHMATRNRVGRVEPHRSIDDTLMSPRC